MLAAAAPKHLPLWMRAVVLIYLHLLCDVLNLEAVFFLSFSVFSKNSNYPCGQRSKHPMVASVSTSLVFDAGKIDYLLPCLLV